MTNFGLFSNFKRLKKLSKTVLSIFICGTPRQVLLSFLASVLYRPSHKFQHIFLINSVFSPDYKYNKNFNGNNSFKSYKLSKFTTCLKPHSRNKLSLPLFLTRISIFLVVLFILITNM